jgi:hypothetical protein
MESTRRNAQVIGQYYKATEVGTERGRPLRGVPGQSRGHNSSRKAEAQQGGQKPRPARYTRKRLHCILPRAQPYRTSQIYRDPRSLKPPVKPQHTCLVCAQKAGLAAYIYAWRGTRSAGIVNRYTERMHWARIRGYSSAGTAAAFAREAWQYPGMPAVHLGRAQGYSRLQQETIRSTNLYIVLCCSYVYSGGIETGAPCCGDDVQQRTGDSWQGRAGGSLKEHAGSVTHRRCYMRIGKSKMPSWGHLGLRGGLRGPSPPFWDALVTAACSCVVDGVTS